MHSTLKVRSHRMRCVAVPGAAAVQRIRCKRTSAFRSTINLLLKNNTITPVLVACKKTDEILECRNFFLFFGYLASTFYD